MRSLVWSGRIAFLVGRTLVGRPEAPKLIDGGGVPAVACVVQPGFGLPGVLAPPALVVWRAGVRVSWLVAIVIGRFGWIVLTGRADTW